MPSVKRPDGIQTFSKIVGTDNPLKNSGGAVLVVYIYTKKHIKP